MIKTPEGYPFLYETHLHTSQGSACGMYTGAEMAKACKEAGYAGLFVTDHNWGGNTAVSRYLPWKNWVQEFVRGYEDAKRCGDDIGIDVFLGYEAGYQGTEFLIYGIDKQFLFDTPELKTATVEKQYALVKQAGGTVIHAHPFREEAYIPSIRLYPDFVDGVEVINACHSNQKTRNYESRTVYDERAIAYAGEKKLPMTAGSDIHFTSLLGGGVACKKKWKDGTDYGNMLLSGEDYLLTNGDNWFSKSGRILEGTGIA